LGFPANSDRNLDCKDNLQRFSLIFQREFLILELANFIKESGILSINISSLIIKIICEFIYLSFKLHLFHCSQAILFCETMDVNKMARIRVLLDLLNYVQCSLIHIQCYF
jgi:hypothetical protein